MKSAYYELFCNYSNSIINIFFFIFFVFYFRFLFTTDILNSSDLNFHIFHIIKYKSLWYKDIFSFYNPSTFTGWPDTQFYGFLPYLITVFVSYLLDPFTHESVRLGTHLIILFGLSSMVFSMNYALRPFIEHYLKSDNEAKNCILKIFCSVTLSVLLLWFFNRKSGIGGMGANSIVSIGLYTQLFGWHILILYVGILFRIIYFNRKNLYIYLALLFGLSLISHIITSTFIFALTLYYILVIDNYRWLLIKSLLAGFLLSSFWLIPFVTYVGDYTVYNSDISRNDLLIKMLEYPISSMIVSLKYILKGHNLYINYSNIVVLLLLISSFFNSIIKKDRIFITLLIFILLFLVFTGGVYPAASIPLALHYYRYQGFIIILLILMLSAISFTWFQYAYSINSSKISSFIILVLCSLLFIIFLSNLYVSNIKNKNPKLVSNNYSGQQKVYSSIASTNEKARVFTEYLTNDSEFPPYMSYHYLSLLFAKGKSTESITDIFLEASKSNYYLSSSFKFLGASTYPKDLLLNRNNTNLDNDTLIEQIKSFGITHIVAGNKTFFNNIKKYAVDKPSIINNYRIVKLQDADFQNIYPISKIPVGYLDLKDTLNFSLIDYYIYINRALTNTYELINLDTLNNIPAMINTIIINYLPVNIENFVKSNNLAGKKIIFIDYTNLTQLINNDNVIFTTNPVRTETMYVKEYLDKKINLPAQISRLSNSVQKYKTDISTGHLNWKDENQKFTITGLTPGALYRINYSYFPYWHSYDGVLYRGSKERMFFIPYKKSAQFIYTKLYSSSTWYGLVLTLLGICIIGYHYYQDRINKNSNIV